MTKLIGYEFMGWFLFGSIFCFNLSIVVKISLIWVRELTACPILNFFFASKWSYINQKEQQPNKLLKESRASTETRILVPNTYKRKGQICRGESSRNRVLAAPFCHLISKPITNSKGLNEINRIKRSWQRDDAFNVAKCSPVREKFCNVVQGLDHQFCMTFKNEKVPALSDGKSASF